MKKIIKNLSFAVAVIMFASCGNKGNSNEATASTETAVEQPVEGGQSQVKDDVSEKNIVQTAIASKDHSTLVAAVKAGELVDALSNSGPFTVFAPTNDAFNKLPAGTVEGLLKPEKKADLQNILQYHVSVGVFNAESFKDGQTIGQVNGDNVKMEVKDGKVKVNGANIVGSVKTSNGVIHVIDAVLLPPQKK